MRSRTLVASSLVLMLAVPALAADYSKDLGISLDSQDQNYTCGVAVIKMWVNWLHSKSYTETEIEDEADSKGYDVYGTGLTPSELAQVLEEFSSHWFNYDSSSSSSTMSSTIVKEIYSGEPIAMSGYTRYSDSSKTDRAGGHWYLVDAFKNNQSTYSSSSSKIKGFYFQDPMYGAGFSGYDTTSPSTFVTTSDFFTYVASKNDGTNYYLVKD